MMLVETPIVVHARSPSVESISTRTTASVSASRVEDAHPVVGEVDVGEVRVRAHEHAPQRLVEGVDGAVALADGDEALLADPELHRGLGVDRRLGAAAAPGPVVGGGAVALDLGSSPAPSRWPGA